LNEDFGHRVGAESNKPDDPPTPFHEGMNALRDLVREDLGAFGLRSVIEDQGKAGNAPALEPGCPYQKALNAAFFTKIDDMVRESDPSLDRESDRNGNVLSLNLPRPKGNGPRYKSELSPGWDALRPLDFDQQDRVYAAKRPSELGENGAGLSREARGRERTDHRARFLM
jgi:hypothetical protein